MVLLPVQAQSQDGGHWTHRLVGYNWDGTARYVRVFCRWDGHCYRPGQARYRRAATRVYSYVHRESSVDDYGLCRETRRAVGDQHLTLDGAKKAANDAWAGTIRFHLGEKFMDLANAKHIVYTCSRSSIKEGGVTTLGQTLSRCEIEAQPCRPPKETQANER
jgi:hypothetical protein